MLPVGLHFCKRTTPNFPVQSEASKEIFSSL
jgi:hypothetical protein